MPWLGHPSTLDDAGQFFLANARNKNPATQAGSSAHAGFLLSVELAPSRKAYPRDGEAEKGEGGGFEDSKTVVNTQLKEPSPI